MKNLFHYFIMKTPEARMGEQVAPAPGTVLPPAAPGSVPATRIVLSLIGLLVGIVASFFITGLGVQTQTKGSTAGTTQQTTTTTAQASAPLQQKPEVHPLTLQHFLQVLLIAVVICGLTYQGLYFSLRLYEGQPTFLILFVSFQYGYFWQSVVSALRG